jgi:hypothetical protein
MNRFTLTLFAASLVAVTMAFPKDVSAQVDCTLLPERMATADAVTSPKDWHSSRRRLDGIVQFSCSLPPSSDEPQEEAGRWPAFSLGAAGVGWGGTVQHAGFEVRARIGQAPSRLGVVWGQGGSGTFKTGWTGVELTSTATRLLRGELALGVAAGSYSESNTIAGADGALVRVSDRDWTLGPLMSLRWTSDRPLAGFEIEGFLRWMVGLGDEERYHAPAVGLSVGAPGVQSGAPVRELDHPRVAFHLAAGIAPGSLRGSSELLPMTRGGVDLHVGDVTGRAFGDMEFDGDDRDAYSLGTAVLLRLRGGDPNSVYMGAALRRYFETLGNGTESSWIGGPVVEVRRRVGERLALTLSAERSWGFDTTGESIRIDGLTIGLRR